MERLGKIALQGSSRGLLSPLLLFLVVHTTISGIPAQAADAETACRSPFARVVSIQGSVEVLRSGTNAWMRVARLDTSICPGDRLRTGPQSRAALFVQPETLVRVDQNTSATFNQTDVETAVEFTQEEIVPVSVSAHACGAGYFITRFPRKFKVRTPHLNAAVEGTEFLVAMRCESTDLSVLEGKVLATSAGTNVFPSQSVVSGHSLTVGGSEPPAIKLLIKPADAVQWTLYYPPITPADAVPVDDCRDVAADNRTSCLIARAERYLRAGRVDEAQANIGDALAVAPYSSDAKALSSVISLVKNDKAEALRLAKEAVDASSSSAPAWLALSYAQQADFKLEAALTSAQRAGEITRSALALARVAELQLSLGWTREAEKTAKQAVIANPSESRAQMILGFVHLVQINVKAASEDFERAIELDSTDPLSRLGLGLAIIRTGNLVEGREQIEIAVALDPTNSLIRSYVGKAYYEENTKDRDQLASVQFELAKTLDPKDPTPWFYDSILRQSQIRPVEALIDLQKSIALNDNRAVYRSKLLLDQDNASRSAGLAANYQALGFDRLAVVEGYQSLNMDPTNFSGHRVLADGLFGQPRHEIARVSEALQSQVWQAPNAKPLPPLQLDPQPFILRGAEPLTTALNEYSSLFERDGASVLGSAVVGDNSTRGDQLVLSAHYGPMSGSLSQLHYETNGLQPGWGQTSNIIEGFLQVQPSLDTSIFSEVRQSDKTQGDLSHNFFGENVSLRFKQDRDLARIGMRQRVSDKVSLVGVVTSQTAFDSTEIPVNSPLFNSNFDETFSELQTVYKEPSFYLLIGGGYYRGSGTIDFLGSTDQAVRKATDGYAYIGWEPWARVLKLDIAVSVNEIRDPGFPNVVRQTNPKAGLTLNLWRGGVMRAAAYRGMRLPLIAEQTIEPTQIAGFNQFYDDQLATKVEGGGVAFDQKLSATAFTGIEFSKRRLTVPLAFTDPLETFQWNERDLHAYGYWAPTRNLALSAGYIYERRTEDPQLAEAFLDARTEKVPLGLRVFAPAWNTSYRLTVTGVHQDGSFRLGPDFADGSSRFWLTDVGASYYFPNRRGLLAFDIRNLFDKKFQYQETDIATPTLATGRFAFARIAVSF